MRNRAWVVLAAGLISAGGAGCAGDPPAPAVLSSPGADVPNSYCYVCHVNYREETVASRHEKAGIGCARCHGASENHSSDEDGLTPPEIMFPRERMQASCMACHPVGKLAAGEAHKDVPDAGSPPKKVCTDCHGHHRLQVRTRRWDKATGRLVSDDGVRMMGTPPADPSKR